MADFIDRDPKQMMAYAKNANQVIGEMILLIRKIEGVLDSSEKDLDEPTRNEIKKLHGYCNDYLKKLDVYTRISKNIYDKGKKLDIIRNGG